MTWLIFWYIILFFKYSSCFESSFKDERINVNYNQNGLNHAEPLSNEIDDGKIIIQLVVTKKQNESLIIKTNSSACAAPPKCGHGGPDNGVSSDELLPKIDSLKKILEGIDTLFKNSFERGNDGKTRIVFRLDNFNGSTEALTDTKDELYDLRDYVKSISRKVDAYGIICILLLLVIIAMIGYMIHSQRTTEKGLQNWIKSAPNSYSNGRTHRHGNSTVDCDCNLHY